MPSSSDLDDQSAADLVRERLALVVPERPQPSDVAGQTVEQMREVTHERHTRADRLAAGLADQLEVEHLLADRLSRPAHADEPVPYEQRQRAEVTQHHERCSETAADRGADRGEDVARCWHESVQHVATNPLDPAAEAAR